MIDSIRKGWEEMQGEGGASVAIIGFSPFDMEVLVSK